MVTWNYIRAAHPAEIVPTVLSGESREEGPRTFPPSVRPATLSGEERREFPKLPPLPALQDNIKALPEGEPPLWPGSTPPSSRGGLRVMSARSASTSQKEHPPQAVPSTPKKPRTPRMSVSSVREEQQNRESKVPSSLKRLLNVRKHAASGLGPLSLNLLGGSRTT